MDINTLKTQLKESHETLWDTCASFPSELQNKSNGEDKWSPVQHVQHITKGIAAFYKYLKTDKTSIAGAFGTTGTGSRTYQQLLDAYNKRMSEGAKSTPQFNPEDNGTIALQTEREKGTHIINGTIAALDNWSEEDLNKYVCPHPALGKLTALEMLYFTIFHAIHHTASIQKLKDLQ